MNKRVALENVSKVYMNKQVLSNISLSIEENQIMAIRGENGTGKSTLLRIIAGIEQPSSGKVTYRNNNMKIGYVPERFPKQIRFTPSEYLHYIGKIGGISVKYLEDRIENLLHRFRLNNVKNQRIMELSKGNIQKVGIIQALIHNPNLLILDEPLSGLDSLAQEELVTIIGEMKQQGTTVLLTYHETNAFESIIERKLYIHNGNISETKVLDNQPVKLLIIKEIKESDVKLWDGVIQVEKKEDQLFLYVSSRDSDVILLRVLQLGGSIEAVSTVRGNYRRS
ncbi:ABC transporter ATP-binding protein [Paucisalibacillus sp. EB02]|uniref:ABC transporter ATP-binding protein n=1 Tax=Paucisalibacillus sp. EB02 TaxID=1347087 RepID=UPI0004BAB096|nr:ABC transporter ATP-binding protein [Paucisalibacillus sp. EB02]